MMDIIAIAMLCQLNTGSVNKEDVEKMQKSCQAYFANCLEDKSLLKCIKERK